MTAVLRVVVWCFVSLRMLAAAMSRLLGVKRVAAVVRRESLRRELQRLHPDAIVGTGLRVGRRVVLNVGRGANVRIGDGVVLGDDVYVHVFPGATLVLGDGVHINIHARVSAFTRVEVGEQTVLAAFSAIHDHHHRFDLRSPWEKQGYEGAPVTIGKGVLILARVAVTEGVTIGDYSVIGANSVVTHDVPSGTFCGGIPARTIRRADVQGR